MCYRNCVFVLRHPRKSLIHDIQCPIAFFESDLANLQQNVLSCGHFHLNLLPICVPKNHSTFFPFLRYKMKIGDNIQNSKIPFFNIQYKILSEIRVEKKKKHSQIGRSTLHHFVLQPF